MSIEDWRIVLAIALNKVGLLRRGTLEGSLQEQPLHEGADVEANLAPQPLVIGFEDDPLRAVIQARLEEQGQPANGHVLPLRAGLIVACQRAGAPDHVPIHLEFA